MSYEYKLIAQPNVDEFNGELETAMSKGWVRDGDYKVTGLFRITTVSDSYVITQMMKRMLPQELRSNRV